MGEHYTQEARNIGTVNKSYFYENALFCAMCDVLLS